MIEVHCDAPKLGGGGQINFEVKKLGNAMFK